MTPSNPSDIALSKAVDYDVSPSKSKSQRLAIGLFSPNARYIMSTLRDLQEEQQQLSSAISSLRVSTRHS